MPDSDPPKLAVIVIGHRAPARIVEAVTSLLGQNTPLEIVVVNSGGGEARALLAAAGLEVPVIEVSRTLFVGAARNVGIAATQAPFVGFLADDCLACPGWAETRLRRHLAGDRAVASAIVNSHPRNLIACAAHLVTFMRRLPGLPADQALRYGVSFDRRLFDEYGLFDEMIPIAEDTEFLKRLPQVLQPVWEPGVRTVHRNETRLLGLLADQYVRGYRRGDYLAASTRNTPFRFFRDTFRDRRQVRKLAKVGLSGPDLTFAMRSMPVVWLALLVKSVGVYAGARNRGKANWRQKNDH
ncbi:glycosyltransferase family 2 protein [Mesorhizobium sp. AR10]|uniref:glycosyltransferase family 2 protein n=1 Tax=Mesorhizobium sp. AR10 TaxID=2865839 RepID=UPI00215FE9E5|nr:glycosyltransferase family 2 protein [Mesorhizobium sp. AR10]UVK40819.1 glycosyltransferase family 2 protein [Mesorhizobium sp. AR10]